MEPRVPSLGEISAGVGIFVHFLMPIPGAIHGQKYVTLFTFRKNGIAVPTPIWFGEDGDRLYVMTRNDSGKYKHIKNNPLVRVAPCDIRGKITGSEFAGTAEILSRDNWRKGRR